MKRILKWLYRKFNHKYHIPKKRFGLEQNERVVEIPWALSQYAGEQNVLEVGPVGAQPEYLDALRRLPIKELHGVDITEGELEGFIMSNADIRATKYSDGFFDLIFCISTLEHIGQDNSWYDPSKEIKSKSSVVRGNVTDDKTTVGDEDLVAFAEMLRILKKKGKLVLTLPYGKFQNHGWFINYDSELVNRLVNSQKDKIKIAEKRYFAYNLGWYESFETDAIKNNWYQANKATTASAVICITFIKL